MERKKEREGRKEGRKEGKEERRKEGRNKKIGIKINKIIPLPKKTYISKND